MRLVAFTLAKQRVRVSIDTRGEVADRFPPAYGRMVVSREYGCRRLSFAASIIFHGFRDFLGFFNGVDLPSD